MRTLSRGVALVVLTALAALPVTAGDAAAARDAEIAALTRILEGLDQAKAGLTELAKAQIDAGDIDGVKETMEALEDLQAGIGSYRDRLARLRLMKRAAEDRKEAPEGGTSPTPEAAEPPESAAAGPWFGGRSGLRNLNAEGGSSATQGAVDLALEWLKNHQDPKGCWETAGFMKQCKLSQCGGPGNPEYGVGVTGLALMAFLGAGQTDRHGDYQKTLARGLGYLQIVQDAEGCISPRTVVHFIYNHAFATQAMAEAYGLTGDPHYKLAAERAVGFLQKAQNPYLAWRYGVRPQDNDTSVTACVISALHAAKAAGLKVDQAAFDGASAWLSKVTEPEYGRVGYTARGTGPARPQNRMDKFPADKSESLTAAGILMRVLLGEDPRKSEMIQKGADLCLKTMPVWDENSGAIDQYYWYYGSQALFQVGGDAWKTWNVALKNAMVGSQRKDGDQNGSWDPVGAWGGEGGRVYSTALGALMLETYYRQGRKFSGRTPTRFGRNR